MNPKLQTLYGLKFHPALHHTAREIDIVVLGDDLQGND